MHVDLPVPKEYIARINCYCRLPAEGVQGQGVAKQHHKHRDDKPNEEVKHIELDHLHWK